MKLQIFTLAFGVLRVLSVLLSEVMPSSAYTIESRTYTKKRPIIEAANENALRRFQQTDYKVIHERISLDFYNTSYAKDPKITLFHYTRYEKRFNVSGILLQDLERNVTNVVQGYKFQSNEYREFPVHFEGNACDLMKMDTFGTSAVYYNTNFVPKCPVKKGFYYGTNVYLDDSKLPPFAPRGRYMLELSVYYKKTILLSRGKWYGEIQPTNPLEKVIAG